MIFSLFFSTFLRLFFDLLFSFNFVLGPTPPHNTWEIGPNLLLLISFFVFVLSLRYPRLIADLDAVLDTIHMLYFWGR